jgi:hypothetical protein
VCQCLAGKLPAEASRAPVINQTGWSLELSARGSSPFIDSLGPAILAYAAMLAGREKESDPF